MACHFVEWINMIFIPALQSRVKLALLLSWGPGDQPAFGRAGGLWQPGVVIPAGGVPLAMSLLALPRITSAPLAPARAKSRDRACGEPHSQSFPTGRTTRPVRPLEFQRFRPETGRDNEKSCLKSAGLRHVKAQPFAGSGAAFAPPEASPQLLTTAPTIFSEM